MLGVGAGQPGKARSAVGVKKSRCPSNRHRGLIARATYALKKRDVRRAGNLARQLFQQPPFSIFRLAFRTLHFAFSRTDR